MQLALIHDNTTSKTIISVPTSSLVASRFNPRRTRNHEELERLATRIQRNGFEITRALWAYQSGDKYEVFAGGTRLEAARMAGVETLPIVLHEGFTEEQIVRLADEDNENDEYHTPVGIVDVWADYARLRDEEGWTQERIAQAKGVTQKTVSIRIKLNGLSGKTKHLIRQGAISEGHLTEITSLYVVEYFSDWLFTEQAWDELIVKTLHDKGKNGDKSVRAIREDVSTWKEFIAYAEQGYATLPNSITLYAMDNPPTPYQFNAQAKFVAELSKIGARSLAKVKAAEREVRNLISDNLALYQRWLETKSTEAALAAEQAQREQEMLAKLVLGDCVQALAEWAAGPIKLLLTDPPYGMDYQSNRRWKSNAPDKLAGDGATEAMDLLKRAIEAAIPHLDADAHVLVFCSAKGEPEVRVILEAVGLTYKGSLIWAKEEHSAGDVHGAFGPSHERIVHYVKGSPRLSPRHRDWFTVARSRETDHPTEKPIALLSTLIECTTNEGDLVADPFAGQASTLVAALRLNREFWGAEVSPEHHEKGATRLLKEAARAIHTAEAAA
jgi:site-specific DNA-methyltransferase (adenine-specific)